MAFIAAGVRPSIREPLLYEQVNVLGTMHIFEPCRLHGVDRIVSASSSSVYGSNSKVPFAESDPVDHPISPYAATKKAGELMARPGIVDRAEAFAHSMEAALV